MVCFPKLRMCDRDEDIARPFVAKLRRRNALEDIPENYAGEMKEERQANYFLYRGIFFLSIIEKTVGVFVIVLIYLDRIAGAYGKLGIGFQERYLLLQLMRRGPVIIAF